MYSLSIRLSVILWFRWFRDTNKKVKAKKLPFGTFDNFLAVTIILNLCNAEILSTISRENRKQKNQKTRAT